MPLARTRIRIAWISGVSVIAVCPDLDGSTCGIRGGQQRQIAGSSVAGAVQRTAVSAWKSPTGGIEQCVIREAALGRWQARRTASNVCGRRARFRTTADGRYADDEEKRE